VSARTRLYGADLLLRHRRETAAPSSTRNARSWLRWRDSGLLPDDSLRILRRELDHEERTLPDR
jgi:hypothetical protein